MCFFFVVVVEEKARAICNSEASQNSWLCLKKSPECYNGVGKLKVFKQNFTLMKLFRPPPYGLLFREKVK